MNTEVAISPAKNLENVVALTQSELGEAAGDVARAIATAKGRRMIREAMTEPVMQDLKELMDTPLGFKTDRAGKTAYPTDVIRNVLIAGILKGARVIDNEINIISGELYLTKEFYERKIKQLGFIRDVKWNIGVASVEHRDGVAVMPAVSTWTDTRDGQLHRCEFLKNPDFDGRVVVNSHGSKAPDLLHGKAESKVFRRIYKQMSGQDIPETETLDGSLVPASQIKPKAIEKKPADPKPSEELAESIAKIPSAFAPFGVTVPMLEARLGHSLDVLDQNGVTELTNIYKAIKASEVNAFEVFEFPPIDEDVIRKRFTGLKSSKGIMNAGKELISKGADSDLVDRLANEYLATLKGSE